MSKMYTYINPVKKSVREVDLSGYATKNDLNSKVDRVAGMGLSSNDYTDDEQAKLLGIEENANNYTHPSTHNANMIAITDTANNFTSNNVEGALSELFQYVSDGKSLIATAITDLGVQTSSDETFQSMANKIRQISTGGDTSDTSVYTSQFATALYNASIWQVFGDSISTTYNISESEIWHNLITADSEFSSMTKYNNSLTGSEVADGGRSIDSFIERYTSLNSDADLVTVWGGVNDWSHNLIPLGDFFDTTTSQSFYGALNTLLLGIKAQCPNARIIWISPLKVGANAFSKYITNGLNSYGLTLQDYIQAIKYKCNQYDIEFVDLYGVKGLDPDIDTSNFQSDSVHPTASGQSVIKDYLLNTATVSVPEDEYIPPVVSGDYVAEALSLYLDSANTSNTTTTLADMSGNGNNFTSTVDITYDDNNRVILNGSQYFSNTSYKPHTTANDDFTFEFYGDITSTGKRNYFFSYGSRNGFSWDEQYGLSGQMGSGDVIWVGTDTVNGNANRVAPTFGEKHVIITKNGTTYSIYVDGVLVANQTHTTSWSDSSYTNFRLFVRYNTSNQLQGAMKYIRWYTKGFTAEEVLKNYNSRIS